MIPLSPQKQPLQTSFFSWIPTDIGHLKTKIIENFTLYSFYKHFDTLVALSGLALSSIFFISSVFEKKVGRSILSLNILGVFVYISSRVSETKLILKALKNANSSLEKKVINLGTITKEQKSVVDKLKNMATDQEKQIVQQTKLAKELNTSNTHFEVQIKTLQSTTIEQEKQVDSLTKLNKKIIKDYGELSPKIKKEIKNLKEVRIGVGKEIAGLNVQVKFLKERSDDLKTQNEEFKNHNDELKAQLKVQSNAFKVQSIRHREHAEQLSLIVSQAKMLLPSNTPTQTLSPLSPLSDQVSFSSNSRLVATKT